MRQWKCETHCIQRGYVMGNGNSCMMPIIQSTTFKYDTGAQMGALFDLEADGYSYTRLQNPSNNYVAAKICELEGGTVAMLTTPDDSYHGIAYAERFDKEGPVSPRRRSG